MLFNHMSRFCEYLLSCPSNEVRSAFIKIVVLLAHFSINDGPSPPPAAFNNNDTTGSLSDHILWALLSLLQREVSEHGRHLPHYCSVFHTYANQGKCCNIHEKMLFLFASLSSFAFLPDGLCSLEVLGILKVLKEMCPTRSILWFTFFLFKVY